MAADGQVVFEIQGDNKGLKNTLQDTTSAIQSESKKWDESASGSAKGMEATFGGALKGIAAAFAASQIGKFLVDFGKQAISAASDLQEVQNVVDVTFGESANEINAWAKNAISQFGLTETQAKRFASTMGAMMKSSGIASKDITEMSENLAGLAADMASFYNLDFDEAFNKIRSGISGETEPLKQLGINMSVANLEAFALSKGIEKTFDKMSQGEQVMLRYQYLMEATADAQGDFSRTSDGFANGLRLLQSNFEQLKTTVGTLLLPVISQAISGLNDMMSLLIPATKQKTILDDFAEIDLRKEEKLKAIEETANEASDLISVLQKIQETDVSGKANELSNIAGGANTLNADAGTNWDNFLEGLDGVSGLIAETRGGVVAGINLSGLADGAKDLTGTPVTDFKYENLPPKIQALFDKARDAKGATDELGDLDTGAGKLTKDKQTTFKYEELTGDIGELVGAADSVISNNTKGDLETLGTAADGLTGNNAEAFKYENVKTGVNDLVGEANTASNNQTGTKLGELADGADKLTGDKASYKYKELTEDDGVGELIEESKGGIVAGVQLSGLADGAEKVSGDKKRQFTFGPLTDQSDGVGELISQSSGGTQAGTDLKNLGEGAQEVANVNYPQSGGSIKAIVGDIKLLDSTSKNNWNSILSVFRRIPGYTDKIDSKTIESISSAFSGLEGDKAQAWQTLMGALGSDLTALSTLTGKDEEGAAAWLNDMKEAANGLNNDDVASWNALLSLLANGTPGAGNFVTPEDMARLAQAAGMSSETVKKLGDSSVSVADKNKEWIATCKKLVAILPGLSSIINTETGEINGGIQAVTDYVEAWKKGQRELIYWKAHFEKEAALLNDTGIMDSDLEVMAAEAKVNRLKKASDEWQADWEKRKKQIEDETENLLASTDYSNLFKEKNPFTEELAQAGAELEKAYNTRTTATNAYNDAVQQLKDEEEGLIATFGEESRAAAKASQSMNNGADATDRYNEAQKKAASDGVKALTDALKEMNDYIESTRKSTESSVDSALKGFKQFETGEKYFDRLKKEQAAKEAAELKKQVDEANKNGKVNINVKLTGTESTIPTLQNMTQSLRDQLDFINEYQKNLEIAKQKGVSDELLAEFADFSQENAGYLYLIAHGSQKEVDDLNSAYKRMSEAKKPLIDSLTETKLKADESFNELVAKAKEAAIQLNNGDIAKESMASTVEGIAQGIADKVPEVKEAVDALNAELERLGKVSNYNVFGGLGGTGINLKFGVDGSFAKGADYIPFDNYLAYLHEGEAVLTAEEAAIWRNFKNGGANVANSIDYGRLSGAIWDNAPQMGGNVYLDGRTVGRVISAQQANAYRSLERSGWQG